MPILEAAVAAVVGKVVEKGIESLNDLRRETRSNRVSIDTSQARECLMNQLSATESWAASISLLDLLHDKELKDSFVELSLDVGLTRHGPDKNARRVAGLTDVYESIGHVAILGRPGAGKTTSLQRIAAMILEDWHAGKRGVPILVRLRDLREKSTLFNHILGTLGIHLRVPPRVPVDLRRAWEQRAAIAYLTSVSAQLLVDGLDEVQLSLRTEVERQLRDLALAPGDHRLYLTCRTADFHVSLAGVQSYTIRPLTAQQVKDFARRWLGDKAEAFLAAVKENPYTGTEVVPLTLAHLCAIYEREGELPPRPIEVYEKIVSLLIDQWDRQRNIHRTSKYATFVQRKKERFLQAIAFELAMNDRKGAFREDELEAIYRDIAPAFGLPADEMDAVIEEVESHTGLIHQTGFNTYDFVHLVIHEYLAAMHAHRLAEPTKALIPKYPNEMALVVAYASDPEAYLEKTFQEALNFIEHRVSIDFLIPFLARVSQERPAWGSSARTGWVSLGMLDLITRYLHTLDRKDRLRLPQETARFFKHQAIFTATASAIAESERSEITHAYRFIPKRNAALPEYIEQYLTTKPDAGFLALKSDPVVQKLVKHRRKIGMRARR